MQARPLPSPLGCTLQATLTADNADGHKRSVLTMAAQGSFLFSGDTSGIVKASASAAARPPTILLHHPGRNRLQGQPSRGRAPAAVARPRPPPFCRLLGCGCPRRAGCGCCSLLGPSRCR